MASKKGKSIATQSAAKETTQTQVSPAATPGSSEPSYGDYMRDLLTVRHGKSKSYGGRKKASKKK